MIKYIMFRQLLGPRLKKIILYSVRGWPHMLITNIFYYFVDKIKIRRIVYIYKRLYTSIQEL